MKRTVIIVLLWLCTGQIFAQVDAEPNNGEWETIEVTDDISVRLPPSRDVNGNVYVDLEDIGFYIDVTITSGFETLEAVQDMIDNDVFFTYSSEQSIPIGEAIYAESSIFVDDAPNAIHYYVLTNDGMIFIHSRIPVFSMEYAFMDEFEMMKLITRQVANTLYHTNDNDWTLFADAAGSIYLQAPPSWQKSGNAVGRLTVQETFDDVLVTVQYQDLEQLLTLEVIAASLVDTYANQTVIESGMVNLPIGDALYYHLDDVVIDDDTTHTQYQYIILRDETLIIVTAGANANYFDEYAYTLRQIITTLDLREAIIDFE